MSASVQLHVGVTGGVSASVQLHMGVSASVQLHMGVTGGVTMGVSLSHGIGASLTSSTYLTVQPPSLLGMIGKGENRSA